MQENSTSPCVGKSVSRANSSFLDRVCIPIRSAWIVRLRGSHVEDAEWCKRSLNELSCRHRSTLGAGRRLPSRGEGETAGLATVRFRMAGGCSLGGENTRQSCGGGVATLVGGWCLPQSGEMEIAPYARGVGCRELEVHVESPARVQLHEVGFEEKCRRPDRSTPSR